MGAEGQAEGESRSRGTDSRERRRGQGLGGLLRAAGGMVGSLTAEGAIPPGKGLASLGAQGCVGLQGAAQGQCVTLGPTLAVHTTGEAGVRGHHPMALGEGSWRVRARGHEGREEAWEGSRTRQLLGANVTPISCNYREPRPKTQQRADLSGSHGGARGLSVSICLPPDLPSTSCFTHPPSLRVPLFCLLSWGRKKGPAGDEAYLEGSLRCHS